MKIFCEIMTKEILPGIRALIANELIHEYGVKQTEAAKLLFITQPAISQYTRQIRGNKKHLLDNEIIKYSVKEIAGKLYRNEMKEDDLANEFSDLCNKLHNFETKRHRVNIHQYA